ncbi:MAG: hypothetical protein MJ181_05895 [Treponema sp.]|nr:hypothetical protein [Treponema sp.]
MPGLSQLIQFNKDILSLGDEVQLRAQRGEKPVRIPVPKNIADVDDSEEFVMGMPENEAVAKDTSVDDDLSDLQSLTSSAPAATSTVSSSAEEASTGFEVPDMSALLAPMPATDAFGESTDMPDLSMFEEQPEEEVIEEEPEVTSIADLDLDALLGGAGFDGSSAPTTEETTTSSASDDDLEFYSGGFGDDNYIPQKKKKPAPVLPDLDASEEVEPESFDEGTGGALSLEELGLGDLDSGVSSEPAASPSGLPDSIDDLMGIDDIETLDSGDALSPAEDLSFDEPASGTETAETLDFDPNVLGDIEEISDFEPVEVAAEELESFDDIPDFEEPAAITEPADLSEPFDTGAADSGISDAIELELEDFDDIPSLEDTSFDTDTVTSDNTETSDLSAEAALLSGDLFDENTGSEAAEIEDFSSSPELNEGFGSDFGAATGLDDFDLDGLPDMDQPMDFSSEIPDMSGDFGSADFPSEESSSDSEMEEMPIESFDISEMEGMDFDVPETDAQLDGSADSGSGDFSLDGDDGEFSIPGFSDVETAKEEKRGPLLMTKSGSSEKEAEALPPNTLSDSQYKVFLKNLSTYPLNVRLAFEDLIVKNEFTDEAEFEIVEKILNKAPARQVASLLEKMLDISIPVPRNYEQRTAEEYEAYKKSLSYQLKNKIIPAVFAGFVLVIVGFGLFKFTQNCIYIPAKANHLYKQGYAMLQADEYPQSEIKFNEAVKYRMNKKWFFKYARGYRERKQYFRAEWMYQNILDFFRHDKMAGLEFATMELNDLANFEKAEEICRRQILDFHINDADGILLLGDIYLEWGTEKDPEKLESAREQYATLIQLYKSNKLYEGRMMRYFIRTDNLPEVLTLKAYFLPKEKNLPPEDWTELSGYMLDKLYGPLAPSDEYLRTYIEDVRLLLTRACKTDYTNPIASYNLSRYFIETGENDAAKNTLIDTLDKFKAASQLKRRDLYKYIDTYRLAGEEYAKAQEYLRAQEYYTDGITLYTAERDASGLEGNKKIGQLFADQADMDYFITGDYNNALQNYISSVELENDNSSIRYKIGYIQYKKKNYSEALGSFMKAGDGNIKEINLMLAMGNTLTLRGDHYAAQGYYEDLISNLDKQIADKGKTLTPQAVREDNDLITTYLYASNNYGVTLYRLASRTGNSSFNADAIVQFSQSVRAWDALTRNQETMVRLGGSNLAEENIKYITHPVPDFEPAIYTEIPRTILNNEKISY